MFKAVVNDFAQIGHFDMLDVIALLLYKHLSETSKPILTRNYKTRMQAIFH